MPVPENSTLSAGPKSPPSKRIDLKPSVPLSVMVKADFRAVNQAGQGRFERNYRQQ